MNSVRIVRLLLFSAYVPQSFWFFFPQAARRDEHLASTEERRPRENPSPKPALLTDFFCVCNVGSGFRFLFRPRIDSFPPSRV